jgi:succinyl-CoA synthetase beta subunit
VVVRLEGTNVEQGRKMLKDSGLAITTADDLTDAARKAVAAVATVGAPSGATAPR